MIASLLITSDQEDFAFTDFHFATNCNYNRIYPIVMVLFLQYLSHMEYFSPSCLRFVYLADTMLYPVWLAFAHQQTVIALFDMGYSDICIEA